ncbi:Gfo/Idh/MocA family protein [Nakamurella sp. GG22]
MRFPSALPVPRTSDSMLAPVLRWGVLGPGWIAERFVRSVQRHTRQQVTAVASRDLDRASAFAATHGIGQANGSYEQLVNDPAIDVVYIATPHNAHFPLAAMALEAGKHTLVEKPMALNAGQASALSALAASQGVLLVEALWTMFLPKFDVIRQLLADGVLGDVRTVLADHGEYFADGHRILPPDLAGGPLLDLGTYPVSFAGWVLGQPAAVQAAGRAHPAGVNGQVSAILSDDDGNQAVLNTTVFSSTPTTGVIAGTEATLSIGGPFYQPGDMTLTSAGGTVLSYTEPAVSHDALHFEAAAMARLIGAGALESPLRTHAESICTLRIIDEVRRQLGIVFDEEV